MGNLHHFLDMFFFLIFVNNKAGCLLAILMIKLLKQQYTKATIPFIAFSGTKYFFGNNP